MKGSSNIVSSVHCLAQAKAHFESFCREHPGGKGERLFKSYIAKLNWIVSDLTSNYNLPESVREGIKAEWNSDVFSVPAITEKVSLLNPSQRELIELTIDAMLNGEEIQILDTNQTK